MTYQDVFLNYINVLTKNICVDFKFEKYEECWSVKLFFTKRTYLIFAELYKIRYNTVVGVQSKRSENKLYLNIIIEIKKI